MEAFPQGPWVSRACSVLLLTVGTCFLGIAAQSSLSGSGQTMVHRVSLPPLPSPPDTPHEQFLPYWTTEKGWESEIQMRNNRASDERTLPMSG